MNKYMQLAVDTAYEGIRKGEGGPFGACIVKEGQILAIAHNTVLSSQDPTCHAEMNAIRKAVKVLKSHNLEGCELYTTAEPCPMCLAAIYWARIDKIYVGVGRECAAKYGFDDVFFYQQLSLAKDRRDLTMIENLMSEECENVFREWKDSEGLLY
ncbi:MAG: nucleoside deaminase [Chlamydiota bacterium]